MNVFAGAQLPAIALISGNFQPFDALMLPCLDGKE
jgi:hypothetical protein